MPVRPRHSNTFAKSRKGHEARIAYVEKDGQKWATEIRFKGPVKVAKQDLVDYAYVKQARRPGHRQLHADRLTPAATLPAGHDPGLGQHSLSDLGQGRQPPAGRQDHATGVLLPGRDLPDESAVTAQGHCARLHEHQGLSRGCAGMADQGLPGDASAVRQGSVCRQGHPGRHRRRTLARRSQERAHQGCRRHAGRDGEVAAQVLPAGQAAGTDHRL